MLGAAELIGEALGPAARRGVVQARGGGLVLGAAELTGEAWGPAARWARYWVT